MKQNTLSGKIHYSGIALHTGIRAHLDILPAPVNTGITIVRKDLPDNPSGQAIASNVVDVQRATTIACGTAVVHTVEHVLAALYASQIDNASIEMTGPEPPIADGSSDAYIKLIDEIGIKEQDAEANVCEIDKAIWIEQGESKLLIIPDDDYRISCTVKYGASVLDTQYRELKITRDNFRSDLSTARTFCLYEEIEYLMKGNLIKGGSLDNAVVLKDDAIICKDGLRFEDEFVRHKMLDIVGDLSLIACRLKGQIIAIKPGHKINVGLAQKIISVMGLHSKGK
jgi:UDP-3-O-acyl N-acetylglucosamine deacetylase